MVYEVRALKVENVSGFTSATLNLDRQNIVLVGTNNAGKTTLLRLLEWIFNTADRRLLANSRELSDFEARLLVPARQTLNAARRLTVSIAIGDGRTAKRYSAIDRVVALRFRILSDGIFAAIGKPSVGEKHESEPLAIELLERLQSEHSVVYVPSVRDASSDTFSTLVLANLQRLLEEKVVHQIQGGTTAEYRKIKPALKAITSVAESQATRLWDAMRAGLPAEMQPDAEFALEADHSDIVRWMLEHMRARFTTGDHDSSRVFAESLGAGLQSLLLFSLLQLGSDPRKRRTLLIEEPEAMLHPSAQRLMARSLFDRTDVDVIASTHSPVIVDESFAPDVSIVCNRRVFTASDTDRRRSEINTALLTGQGSEALFARSVLLVEGPGDKALFERLRRRMYAFMPADAVSQLAVVAVGGKEQFAPWVRLLEGYFDQAIGERPIHWLVLADSIDSTSAVTRAMTEASQIVPNELRRQLALIPQKRADNADGTNNIKEIADATRSANDIAARLRVPIHFAPVDLEYMVLSRAGQKRVDEVCIEAALPPMTIGQLLSRLGSKGGDTGAGDKKHPWLRERIALTIDWSEVNSDVRSVLWRWLSPLVSTPRPSQLK